MRLLLAFALALTFSTAAQALGMCGKRADFLAALKGKYNETGRAIAIAGEVNLVEVFASKAGTWTILITTPEGKTCIIAAGNSWEDLPPHIEENDT